MCPNNETSRENRPPETSGGVNNRSAGNNASKPKGTASPVQFPTLSLPKGGGAIQGIGEKFQSNPVTGTGSMSVPIAVSPGRSGFAPQLALSYDSGSGNGAFGLGWDVGLPSISRKTQKGLPQYDGLPKYQDGTDQDSDVFLLSGAEDLVPVLNADGQRKKVTDVAGFTIYPYRPRIEGLFAKIEKWLTVDGDVHWRATTKDNLTSVYGLNAGSRIADPADSNKVFSWLLERTFDNKGNVLIYEYKPEDLVGVAPAIFEKNRNASNATAQQYLKRVKYGNTAMYSSPMNAPIAAIPASNEWLFELIFDYGEHETVNKVPQYADNLTWAARLDPFSSYRAGFEIRDYRLCQRILMFHHFPNELDVRGECLVKATVLDYDQNEIATQVKSITHIGYRRYWEKISDNPFIEEEHYEQKPFPPVSFKYTKQKIDNTIYSIAAANLPNAPEGIDGKRYQLADLDGEGLPGIFTQSENAWYYKRNLGDGVFGPKEVVKNRPVPAGAGVSDYEGNGLNDYVLQNGGLNGYFEMDDLGEWQNFRSFTDIPNIDWNDPNMRSLDLDGDGIADLLITENDCFVWYPSKAKEGFDPARRVSKALDEEQGPRIVFQEAFQTIFLADLSGSGMTDICRIRNGEVCYWPNLGYARFGAKVTMANAPHFDHPDAFDPARIRLADIDGAGPTDIIYLGGGQMSYWINQSGNAWSERITVPGFPAMTPLHSIQAMDLLGNGTSCIVWSSPMPGDAFAPIRYIQLMGKTETEGNKPYLLKEVDNNMGAITLLKYESSTRFYLDDRKAGKPWITKLPFPVQVLTRQEVYDAISDTHFVTKHAYHHGYFDPVEREFRGFGMVEQWDTEDYDTFTEERLFKTVGENWQKDSYIPPVHTKTWFHNGFYRQGGKITRQYESEYYGSRDANGKLIEWTLEDTVLPTGLIGDVTCEAARALKGRPLRVEVFALDEPMLFKVETGKIDEPVVGKINNNINKVWKAVFALHNIPFQNDDATISKIDPDKWEVLQQSRNWKYRIERKNGVYSVFDIEVRKHPYTATESNYQIKTIQPKGDNRHTVFFAAENETLTFQYERNPNDPRIAHSFALEIDEFGNPLRSLAVVYPRRAATIEDEQKALYCTLTEAKFINRPNETTFYRVGVPYQQQLFEVTGLKFLGNQAFLKSDLLTALDGKILIPIPIPAAETIDFSETIDLSKVQKRIVQFAKTTFYNDTVDGELNEGEIAHHGLPFKAWEAAYTDAQLQAWFDTKLPANAMTDGRYEFENGYWWRPSGKVIFDPAQFYLPLQQIDLFGQTVTLEYDAYRLLPKRSFTSIHNVQLETSAKFDYRTLQPKLLTDPNGNRSAAAFDALGMVTHTSAMGKDGENIGDADLLDPLIFNPMAFSDGLEFRNTALAVPHSFLLGAGTFSYYNLHNWRLNNEPNYAMSIVRETHPVDPSDPNTFDASKVQFAFAYSDGFGRQIMMKVQAEKGDALVYNNGQLTTEPADPRWVGNGRTIFNNKGKPVKQYEPYFSKTFEYENETALVEYGVTPILHYDPAGRVVRTDMPDGTFTKVEFTPWEQQTWDQNDTVLASIWFARRTDTSRPDFINNAYQHEAALLAKDHANTPAVAHLDALGRVFLAEANNGVAGVYLTRIDLDIEGNQRSVTDAKGRKVMEYRYNMNGETIQTISMDAGKRWMLTNALGNPLRTWDERGHEFQYFYDALHRPTESKILGGDGTMALDHVFEKIEYGESQPTPESKNLQGQVFRHYDTGGRLEMPEYDFKGKPTETRRRLFSKYKEVANWVGVNLTADLEAEIFTFATETDALGRISKQTAPDGSVIFPQYNEGGFLEAESVQHLGTAAVFYLKNLDYNEKGQRERIKYGNDVVTKFEYDAETFRLLRLVSRRANGDLLQDLNYTYDPVGNITHLNDLAVPQQFFNNFQMDGLRTFKYDALYRLVEATGRENDVSLNHNSKDNWHDAAFIVSHNPNDGMAMRNYIQKYQFDAVGNILQMQHQAVGNTANNWTRDYTYETTSNRLKTTQIGSSTPYEYDHHAAHGFMAAMPHLEEVGWNFKEEIVRTIRQKMNSGTPETTYYQYDGQGQRIRKFTENASASGNPTKKEERIYIAGYELYKNYNVTDAGLVLERRSLSLLDEGHRFVMVETRNNVDDGTEKHLVRYQFHNHLGSATLELDADAAVISYEEYHPYGTTAYQAKNALIKSAAKRYRYTGMERDEESGLAYHSARYYLSWLGRWGNADPMGLIDGINSYQYSKSNPINYFDSNGFQSNEVSEKKEKELKDVLSASYKKYIENKKDANTQAEFVKSVNDIIDYVDSFKDVPVKVNIENKDLFFDYLKLASIAKNNKKNIYEQGCIGITQICTDQKKEDLFNLAVYKTYDDAKENLEPGGYIFSAHIQDSKLWLENIKEHNLVYITAIAKALAQDKDGPLAHLLTIGQVMLKAKQDEDLDYRETSENKVDISGWEPESLGFNYDFGFFYRENVVFHANQAEKESLGQKMIVYISNKKRWEREINDDTDLSKVFGCDQTPCYGEVDFNRQVFGVVNIKK
jgi:RHS repeat-associated protein